MSKHRVTASSLRNESFSILKSNFISGNCTVFTDSTKITLVLVYEVFFPNKHKPLINKSNNCLWRCVLFNHIPNNRSVNAKGEIIASHRLFGSVVFRVADSLQEQLVAWSNNTASCIHASIDARLQRLFNVNFGH